MRFAGYGAIQFLATQWIMWDIIYKSRIIESLFLKVGNTVKAWGKT